MVIIGAINDLGTAQADAEKVFTTLSANSKTFWLEFGPSKSGLQNLKDERFSNTFFAIVFGGVIAGLILM